MIVGGRNRCALLPALAIAWPVLAMTLAALATGCRREAPRPASEGTADRGPEPEAFCQQVDRLSEEDLSDATPDERRAAHAVCVEASTEDRARFPEWGPCARCTMEVSSLDELDVRCHAVCATLEAKMQAQAPDDASTGD